MEDLPIKYKNYNRVADKLLKSNDEAEKQTLLNELDEIKKTIAKKGQNIKDKMDQ